MFRWEVGIALSIEGSFPDIPYFCWRIPCTSLQLNLPRNIVDAMTPEEVLLREVETTFSLIGTRLPYHVPQKARPSPSKPESQEGLPTNPRGGG